MSFTNEKLHNEVSRKAERKNDPTFRSVQSADIDAFNKEQNEENIKKRTIDNVQFLQVLKRVLVSIEFPIQKNTLIEKIKRITKDVSIITFLENIPDKEYLQKKEILEIIEK